MAATEDLSPEEVDALIVEFGQKLDRLKVLYDQYFMGVERQPPFQVQKQVVRMSYRLQRAKLKGAAQKFRFQSLMQRYSTHKAFWSRSMREIEEGRHKSQVARQRNTDKRDKSANAEDDGELTVADYLAIRMVKDMEGDEAAARVAAERKKARQQEAKSAAQQFLDDVKKGRISTSMPPVSKAPSKPPPDVRGMPADEVAKKADKLREMRRRMKGGEEAIQRRRAAAAAKSGAAAGTPVDADRQVYERLVQAKRQLQQDTSKLSYDAVKSGLAKQRSIVQKKHQCSRVDFDVVVKDGKAFLKPIPVNES